MFTIWLLIGFGQLMGGLKVMELLILQVVLLFMLSPDFPLWRNFLVKYEVFVLIREIFLSLRYSLVIGPRRGFNKHTFHVVNIQEVFVGTGLLW